MLVNYPSLLLNLVPLACYPTNYLSLKYARNRLLLVRFIELRFSDLPACK